jgi:hypothetical protein
MGVKDRLGATDDLHGAPNLRRIEPKLEVVAIFEA